MLRRRRARGRAYLARSPKDATGLGDAVTGHARAGRVRFYQPIAQAASSERADHRHQPSRAATDAVRRNGCPGRPGAHTQLRIAEPTRDAPGDDARARESHCDQVPENMIDGWRYPVARDARIAASPARGDQRDGPCSSPAGHVRRDRGVRPLARQARDATIASVAFREVDGAATKPATRRCDSPATPLPFDYVWFTPKIDDAIHARRSKNRWRRSGSDRGQAHLRPAAESDGTRVSSCALASRHPQEPRGPLAQEAGSRPARCSGRS